MTQTQTATLSHALSVIENALQYPIRIVDIGHAAAMHHDDAAIKYAGLEIPTGRYVMMQVRLLVPIEDGQENQ